MLLLLLFLDLTMFCNISLYFGSEFSLRTSCGPVCLLPSFFCNMTNNLWYTRYANPVTARLPMAPNTGFAMRSLLSAT